MNLYLIEQDVNNNWDTYDSAVVVANSEDEARFIHPNDYEWDGKMETYSNWCNAENVKVTYLGKAKEGLKKGEVICASFNAG